jgi:glycine cleavage system H protein
MNLPDNLLYTKEHEWARIEDGKAVVGITDYAQSHLGDITYVELPEAGKKLRQFEALASIDSVKAASDIYAPVSGTILEVNIGLESRPESVNNAPYGAGWIAKIEISDLSETKNLMDSRKYKEYLTTLK